MRERFRINDPRSHFLVARQRALDLLCGDERLVVLHDGPFGDTSIILRAWLATIATPDLSVAHVIGPDPRITEEQYWSTVARMLHEHADHPAPTTDATTPFTGVLHALSVQQTPVVLLLDDLHLISDAVSRVNDLLEHAPAAGMRVIASTKFEGQWRGRIARHLSEKFISSESLEFDTDDVGALLRLNDLDYDMRSPEIIHRLTGGLPTLVHAVCSMAPASEIAEPSHLAEYIPAIIVDEVDRTIRRHDCFAAHRRLLLLAAAADPLTRDTVSLLCEGDADTSALEGGVSLEAILECGGMRRITGSPYNGEWSFPETVRTSLLHLARSEIPDQLHDHQVALTRLWLRLGRPDRALRIAEEAEDWPLVVGILRENFASLYSANLPTTLDDQVLARVPEHLLEDDPALMRMRSMHLGLAAPRDTPGKTLPYRPTVEFNSDFSLAEQPDRSGNLDYVVRVIELRVNARYRDSAALCDLALDLPFPDLDALSAQDRDGEGMVYVHIGLSLLIVGRFDDAIHSLRRAYRTALKPFIHRDAAGKLALIHALIGNFNVAKTWLDEERRHPPLPAETERSVRPAGDIAAAVLALDGNDADTAADILHDLGLPANREELWGFIVWSWGRLGLATGNAANALRHIDKEIQRFRLMSNRGAVFDHLLDGVRADLLLMCGQAGLAAELVADSTHPLTAPARARILLLTDDPAGALALARDALSDLQTTPRDAIELELIAAVAALATGDRAHASVFLDRAMSAYRLSGRRQVFQTLPLHALRPLIALDADLPLDTTTTRPDFGSLRFEPGPEPTGSGEADARTRRPAPVEPLTERELHVLGHLATDATIRQIAARNVLSANTIKSQIRSIYRKLAVHSRDDAVAAAQRLGVLSPRSHDR